MSTHRLALPALILASIIGGTGPIAIKFILQDLDPLTTLFLRFLIASFILLPFVIKERLQLNLKFFRSSLILSLLSFFNVTLFIIGINFTTALSSSLLYLLPTPIIAILTHLRRKHETINPNQWAGLTLSLIGVTIILFRSFTHPQEVINSIGTPLGNSLILAAVICYSLYLYLSQPLSRTYSPLLLTATNFTVTTILSASLTLRGNTFHTFLSLKPLTLILLLYVSTIFSIGMYLFYQWGIKHTSSYIAAATFPLGPLVTAALAVPILGERLTPHLLVGGITILTGVFLSQPRTVLRSGTGAI